MTNPEKEVAVDEEQAARAYVADRIKVEKAEIADRLKRLAKEQPAIQRAYDKTWERHQAQPADKDDPGIAEAVERASTALFRAIDAEIAERQRLDALDNPAEIERRVNTHIRVNNLRNGGSRMASNNNSEKREKVEPPKELVARIVADINGGLGLTAVARKLNEEGVPTVGRTDMWRTQTVWRIYLKATGHNGMKDARAKHPVASKKTADAPAKPVEKLAPAAKTEAKPDPKPTPKKPKKNTAKATA